MSRTKYWSELVGWTVVIRVKGSFARFCARLQNMSGDLPSVPLILSDKVQIAI